MHEFKDLQATAAAMYSDTDTRKWLFSHTRNEGEYAILRHAMKVLAEFRPVQWEGKPGDRHPVEVRA